MDELLKECVFYFKNDKGFKRLFLGIKEKYCSLGYIGGTVKLVNLEECEKNAFRKFFCKDYSDKKTVTISVSAVEKALLSTKYEAFSLFDILEAYFSETLVSNSYVKNEYEICKQAYFEDVFSCIENNEVQKWFSNVISNKISPYNMIVQKYTTDKEELAKEIKNVSLALSIIIIDKKNEKYDLKRLAVFSTDITSNPHYFDEGNLANKILTSGLCFFSKIKEPNNAEEKAELFYKNYIIKDDISIYTVCYGLEAFFKDGSKHLGWSNFSDIKEPMHISLTNISKIDRVKPKNENKKIVYIVENPTVFSAILDMCSDISFSMICSNGQPRISTLILLDKLFKENTDFYYSGDFDPEGILIADRFKKRYGEKLHLWNYNVSDYLDALSEEKISENSIAKLNKVENEQLKDVANKILELKKAGFQEKIIAKYISDILKTY